MTTMTAQPDAPAEEQRGGTDPDWDRARPGQPLPAKEDPEYSDPPVDQAPRRKSRVYLTGAEADEVRCRIADGRKFKDIAEQFGVSRGVVSDIAHGTWRPQQGRARVRDLDGNLGLARVKARPREQGQMGIGYADWCGHPACGGD